jgi:predicted enzyme related to lactoylglutathione lyase
MNPFKTHGALSWPELQTINPSEALDFYQAVFGWEGENMPMPGGMGSYSVGKVAGIPHAGVMERVSVEMPPCWLFYVTVDSADEMPAKATELGGQVFMPVMAAEGVGKMCGIADPQGAMIFGMEWEQNDNPAVDFTDSFQTPGKFSWFHLQTPDVEGAVAFYSGRFGWKTEVNLMGAGPYTILKVGDVSFGGAVPPMGEAPAHWSGYLTVADADETASAIGANGGTVMGEPFDIPEVGKMVSFQDPQGAQCMAIAYHTPTE